MYKVNDGCPGCGSCLDVCPVGAIILGTSLAVVITDNCIDCGLCLVSCPINLIEKGDQAAEEPMEEPVKGVEVDDETYPGV